MKEQTKSALLCVLALILGVLVSGACLAVDQDREDWLLIPFYENQIIEVESNIAKLEDELEAEKNRVKALRKLLEIVRKNP